jgi:hypothetical protein
MSQKNKSIFIPKKHGDYKKFDFVRFAEFFLQTK